MIKRILRKLELLIAIPHELSHYLAARLLSMRAIFGLRATAVHGGGPMWKQLVVTLAPTFTSLIVLVPFIDWYLHLDAQRLAFSARGIIAYLGLSYGIMLLVTCVGDWRDMIYILQGKMERIPRYESQSQLDNW